MVSQRKASWGKTIATRHIIREIQHDAMFCACLAFCIFLFEYNELDQVGRTDGIPTIVADVYSWIPCFGAITNLRSFAPHVSG